MHSASPFIFSFLLILSIPVIFFVAPRILPPKTLPSIPDPDEADDLALFRRATLSSATALRRRPPPQHQPSPPKIAFLFLTNSDLVFAPLWEKFFRGHHKFFNVYIHLDPNSALNTSLLTPSFHDRFIPAKATQRASPTLISAARRLLAAALLDDPSNAYFALVSQHCVPLHSFHYAYRAIFSDTDRHRRKSFIEILDSEPHLMNRYVARGDNIMLPEVPFEKFRVGSQFFVLARRHAVVVVRDRKLWKKFKLPCLKAREHSCYPEEHYFPTLLSMQDSQGCTHYTLTRVNWTGSVDGHPHLYAPAEVTADLVWELRRSNSTYSFLFARKFVPACLEPLMKIADSVIFRD